MRLVRIHKFLCLTPALKHPKVVVVAMLAVCLMAACGKRGAPVPPRERVLQRVEIAGFQRGNQVIISWKMPGRNAPKNSVLNISRADIYRLAEPVNAPVQLSDEEFANRSTLIAALAITAADLARKPLATKTPSSLRVSQPVCVMRYASLTRRVKKPGSQMFC
jgi:hypothetical protein